MQKKTTLHQRFENEVKKINKNKEFNFYQEVN